MSKFQKPARTLYSYIEFQVVCLIILGLCYIFHVQHALFPIVLILISVVNLILSKKNRRCFIVFLLLFYFNYSITVAEYLGLNWISVGNVFEKRFDLYENLILINIFFNLGFGYWAFFSATETYSEKSTVKPQAPFLAWLSIFFAVVILIFGINRVPTESYSVKISPLFEYSSLVILVGLFFSRNLGTRFVIYVLCLLLIIEDLRFGGRTTSAKILLTVYLLWNGENIKNTTTVYGFGLGVMVMSFFGATRGFKIDDPLLIFLNWSANLLTFDTAVYSYYASSTHLMLLESRNSDLVIQSVLSLFGYLVFWGLLPDATYNLTTVAADAGFNSIGGGVAPSFMYFWFGYIGVFLSGLFCSLTYKFFSTGGWGHNLIFIASVASFPRWYLYGPWLLPKTIILMSVFVMIYTTLERLSRK